MSFALRCLFFLVAVCAIGVLLYLYRRKTNQLLLLALVVYVISIGGRLLTIERDDELLVQSLIALAGLGVVWGGVWLASRFLKGRSLDDGD